MILVVDDEKNVRESIIKYLALEGIKAVPAENGLSARRLLEEQVIDAAVVDLKMPGMDGLDLIRWINEEGPMIPVIMISAFGEIRDAVDAMKAGARDYMVKPFDPDELIIRLKRLLEERKNARNLALGKKGGEIVITSRLDNYIRKVAPTDSTVLITGESGTGKEVVAHLIHDLSKRKDNSFVPINIGGMPDNLLESELFGYEKGAFTNATARKQGLVELASGGTLFLDEIGEMPLHLQVKLLRFIQERKIMRLGGTRTIPLDVRILGATNKNLKEMVKEKKFREDLYFRINVISIELPPLRERKEDIPRLAGQFITRFNRIMGRNVKGINDDAMNRLIDYTFPGNIRELENIIERAFIMLEGEEIRERDIDLPIEPSTRQVRGSIKMREKDAVVEALRRWEGNKTKAAAELGISRRTLFNKIKEFDLNL